MSQIPPSQPRGRISADLPIWETVCASYRSVFVENLNYLPNAVVAPFVLSLIIGFFATRISADILVYGGRQATASEILGALFVAAISVVPYVVFAVVWHRLILFGPTKAAPNVIPTWTNRNWRFFGNFLLLCVLSFILSMVIVGLPALAAHFAIGSAVLTVLVIIVALVVALAVTLRLSLVLPAIAVDMSYGLGDAWRQSEKQGLRLVAAIAVITVPLIIVNAATQWLIPNVTTEMIRDPAAILSASVSVLVWIAVFSILNYLAMAIGVSFLSFSFMHLSGWRPADTVRATPPASGQPPSGDAGFHSS